MGMPRCLSVGVGCSRSIPTPATATSPPDAVLRFPIFIGQTVNWGSKNETDVKIIQRALNLFPAADGGPSPKLKDDGVYGPKTNAAIIKFQQKNVGWVDGKVDPGKATINKINEMEPLWLTVPPELIERIYKVTLPIVARCVMAADATMLAARQSILFGETPLNPGARQAALANKHFAFDRNPAKEHDFELISGVFRDMVGLVRHNMNAGADSPQTFVAGPGRFTFSWAYSSGNTALTKSNGVNLRGQTMVVPAQDGSPVTLQDDKIMIFYPYIRSSADAEICTIIHEMAHYLGPPDGNPDVVGDQDGGYGSPERIAHLSPVQRARNAENYSNFAFEACFAREPVNVLI